MQAGRDDGGIVAEEAVARAQKLRQVAKMAVLHGMGGPVHHQEPGLIAPPGRLLRNQPLGQGIVEERGFQFWQGTRTGAGCQQKVRAGRQSAKNGLA